MSSVTPLVVTHPCALVRDGLRPILAKSPFRPVHILPTLNEEPKAIWRRQGPAFGSSGSTSAGQPQMTWCGEWSRRIRSLRAVILTASHTANDILPAFVAGACGFLRQDIPSKQLIKSLELIALGESVMHPYFQQMALISLGGRMRSRSSKVALGGGNHSAFSAPGLQTYGGLAGDWLAGEASSRATTWSRSLSRRELVILRTLTEGASNKIIARKLVITESTVKVHMKAILRKLRLQNRTQAAIWARTHLGELLENAA